MVLDGVRHPRGPGVLKVTDIGLSPPEAGEVCQNFFGLNGSFLPQGQPLMVPDNVRPFQDLKGPEGPLLLKLKPLHYGCR